MAGSSRACWRLPMSTASAKRTTAGSAAPPAPGAVAEQRVACGQFLVSRSIAHSAARRASISGSASVAYADISSICALRRASRELNARRHRVRWLDKPILLRRSSIARPRQHPPTKPPTKPPTTAQHHV
ncbi:hypothetical protein C7974DRAFT_375148 [Boeremia exigua]|uniref:uncharacterized protein n=1 Tax=Boeremia exigua TaxID=749465 RepID=UPI001E8D0A45|nr:uncharacterized protein C7974DRAFT_375148 [Boeremia exigua]KAH6632998.1 hypothetical protein C7974DRAFT_375148 [Boeremia exigua]